MIGKLGKKHSGHTQVISYLPQDTIHTLLKILIIIHEPLHTSSTVFRRV